MPGHGEQRLPYNKSLERKPRSKCSTRKSTLNIICLGLPTLCIHTKIRFLELEYHTSNVVRRDMLKRQFSTLRENGNCYGYTGILLTVTRLVNNRGAPDSIADMTALREEFSLQISNATSNTLFPYYTAVIPKIQAIADLIFTEDMFYAPHDIFVAELLECILIRHDILIVSNSSRLHFS